MPSMGRRSFFEKAAFTAAAGIYGTTGSSDNPVNVSQKKNGETNRKGNKVKPNILLVMGDEHPVFMNGCYGDSNARTPTLDSLARRGAVFDAAYCPSPICAPSRASMMTGRFVSTVEVWDNAAPLSSDWPTFAHSFTSAGYRTILCGKMHFVGPDQHHGFMERWTQDIYPATFDWTPSHRNGIPVNQGQNIDRVYEAGPGWTADMDYDEEVFFRSLYGLRRIIRKNEKQPWLMCVSFTGPHFPYKAPQKYWDMFSDSRIPLPEIPSDYLQREGEQTKWLRQHGKFDHLVSDTVLRRARRAIMGRITMVDDYLVNLLALLGESGMLENTIVIYTSDHGDMMGEHGLWFKNSFYEWSSRIPLVMAGPGIRAGRIAEPVSTMGLGPTLLSLAGVEPVYPITDGQDFSELLGGHTSKIPRRIIIENYGEGVWRGYRMVREGDLKLTLVPETTVELYDLVNDPGEWRNLAENRKYSQVRGRLEKSALEDWDYKEIDEKRWQSEEKRKAILDSGVDNSCWQIPSPPVPHPLDKEF